MHLLLTSLNILIIILILCLGFLLSLDDISVGLVAFRLCCLGFSMLASVIMHTNAPFYFLTGSHIAILINTSDTCLFCLHLPNAVVIHVYHEPWPHLVSFKFKAYHYLFNILLVCISIGSVFHLPFLIYGRFLFSPENLTSKQNKKTGFKKFYIFIILTSDFFLKTYFVF